MGIFSLDKFRLSEYNRIGKGLDKEIIMNGFITVEEAAKKWGVTERQVQILCKQDRINGATRLSRIWIIPENAEKPTRNKNSAV